MQSQDEIWKDIPGFEGTYRASNLGRLRSLDRRVEHKNGTVQYPRGRVLTLSDNSRGYLKASLGAGNQVTVHRVVLCAFTGMALNYPMDIDHIDGDRKNNRVENLRWATRQVNLRNRHPIVASSGVLGVSYDPRRRLPWIASAKLNYKKILIGRFATKEAAALARKKFEADNNWRPNPL